MIDNRFQNIDKRFEVSDTAISELNIFKNQATEKIIAHDTAIEQIQYDLIHVNSLEEVTK